MTRWRRLLDRYAPLMPEGGLSATLDDDPWRGEFSWVNQLNGPSYTIPRIEGTLIVRVKYRRRLLGRIPLRARDVVVQMWIDGTDAWAWLQGGVLVP
jgi:hypothetical protein